MLVIVKNKKKLTPVLRHKTVYKNIFLNKKLRINKKNILKYQVKRAGVSRGIKLINRGEYYKRVKIYFIKKIYFNYEIFSVSLVLKKNLKQYIFLKNIYSIICFHKIQFTLIGEIICLNILKINKFINIFYKNFFFNYFKNKVSIFKYNLLPLWFCKTGFHINNVSYIISYFIKKFIAKAPGCYALIFSYSKKNIYLTVRLPSGKLKLVRVDMLCYIGKNFGSSMSTLGKISIKLKNSKKPVVRGIAKNPVDHPHGGRSNSNKPEKSPWSWIAKYKH